ncbi:hypothetical protein SAMD00019534_028940 [Acytostelium subglobosum LB1]|uniref:hypothetical protein n=1 Tax=Acytostelium subglobosum LB1 TaxID=1410327 RepID=UPI000644A413|nr:hypothetical protein SAMD00019534_028940 [Acytostelium subglobosum LB1]GAM19719.1 hypothetical protein SAMD00019534_028940 [Acytostelium subglobosum LB1]|eukprot:XP_012756481.1 hypothetical protein SAMD00019534_028940 [Acytostelium subglobosum LB1]
MTLLKSMTSLSFNASSMCNGAISSGSAGAFGQSSNGTAGIVAQTGQMIAPVIDAAVGIVQNTVKVVFATADSALAPLGI